MQSRTRSPTRQQPRHTTADADDRARAAKNRVPARLSAPFLTRRSSGSSPGSTCSERSISSSAWPSLPSLTYSCACVCGGGGRCCECCLGRTSGSWLSFLNATRRTRPSFLPLHRPLVPPRPFSPRRPRPKTPTHPPTPPTAHLCEDVDVLVVDALPVLAQKLLQRVDGGRRVAEPGCARAHFWCGCVGGGGGDV